MTQPVETHVYSAFAEIYDQVMRDVDYDTWAEHVLNLCKRHHISVHKILELACGTGSLALRLARGGYEITGVDQSQDMLELARIKLKEQGSEIPLYQAPMQAFSQLGLPQDFDLITCLYDSLNYVLAAEDVKKSFVEAFVHLRPGGVYIFDVTTEYNLLHNFSGFTFAENLDNSSYIWENDYDILKKVCSSKVTIFHRHQPGAYEKQVEMHIQRVYGTNKLKEWLQEAGFTLLGAFHNMSEKPPQDKTERIHFVCQRPEGGMIS